VKEEIGRLAEAMEGEGYVADPAIATAVWLASAMRRPLLVEGDAGVGKTEIAKVLARILDTELIRLQCYEGLDVHTALYEWDYQRQLLRLRIAEAEGSGGRIEDAIFSREYLLERPLLRAITREEGPPVLLIDEIDRADDAFEAFLLEVLSDFQVTVPEIGTIRARHVPYVVLTSNRTRELGDALRRRCLYLWIDQPDLEKELRIIRARVPETGERLAGEVGRFMQAIRRRALYKTPGVAETLDWTRALTRLGVEDLDPETVTETLGCIVKDQHDARDLSREDVAALVEEARAQT
jgi:MoxR-like ATPase